jgi:hypothetical protein
MKEMLGNLAEGQIEFYKTVCSNFYRIPFPDLSPSLLPGDGGMG